MKNVKKIICGRIKAGEIRSDLDFSWSIKIDLYWTIRKENSRRKLLKNEQIQPCKQVEERRKTAILRISDVVINRWKIYQLGRFRTKASEDISEIDWPALYIKGIKLETVESLFFYSPAFLKMAILLHTIF